jgi:hypothetical protein
MGTAARRHYLQEFSRDGAVAAVESLLVEVAR